MTEKIAYRLTYAGHVEAVTIVNETEHYATIRLPSCTFRPKGGEVREKKAGRIFPTFAEAKAHVVGCAEYDLETARGRVVVCQRKLDEALAMKEPD